MKTIRLLVFFGAAILVASRLLLASANQSPANAVATHPLTTEKVPGPNFQPASYFADRKAAYQADKVAYPEKYATDAKKEPEWFFTGKPYDADSKSYFFKYRNYRPDSASWMTPDPAGFPDGPNNYAYAPVPTHEIDSLGLEIDHWYCQVSSISNGTGALSGNALSQNAVDTMFGAGTHAVAIAGHSYSEPNGGTLPPYYPNQIVSWSVAGGSLSGLTAHGGLVGFVVQEVYIFTSYVGDQSNPAYHYLEAWGVGSTGGITDSSGNGSMDQFYGAGNHGIEYQGSAAFVTWDNAGGGNPNSWATNMSVTNGLWGFDLLSNTAPQWWSNASPNVSRELFIE